MNKRNWLISESRSITVDQWGEKCERKKCQPVTNAVSCQKLQLGLSCFGKIFFCYLVCVFFFWKRHTRLIFNILSKLAMHSSRISLKILVTCVPCTRTKRNSQSVISRADLLLSYCAHIAPRVICIQSQWFGHGWRAGRESETKIFLAAFSREKQELRPDTRSQKEDKCKLTKLVRSKVCSTLLARSRDF